MAKKNPKIDVHGPRETLTDSPFGALGGLRDALPAAPAAPAAPKAEILTEAAFRVQKTKKGGWPVSFEKRAAGKVVTILGGVSGDGEALLKALKKHCATGGHFNADQIELQGDHRAKVSAWLDRNPA